MNANYHTHTPRCRHASGSESEYIEKALEKGFSVLGFSDHVPQPYPETFKSCIRMGMEELSDYTGTLVSLREKYKDRIKILIGYEAEYSPKYFEPLMKKLREFPLDYMILGQHFVPDEIEGFPSGTGTDDELRLKDYVDLTVEAMSTGLFSYIAHPDIINFTGSNLVYEKHMSRLVEASIKLSVPLEVNFLGFKNHRNYPCERFFSLASQMNADFVLGCDAHVPEQICTVSEIPGLQDFIEHNGIKYNQNLNFPLL